jgi:hypothetical protein
VWVRVEEGNKLGGRVREGRLMSSPKEFAFTGYFTKFRGSPSKFRTF